MKKDNRSPIEILMSQYAICESLKNTMIMNMKAIKKDIKDMKELLKL